MKKIRVGINGFGRIGRVAARMLLNHSHLELAAINSRSDSSSHAYLLKYDSTYGTIPNSIRSEKNIMTIDGKIVQIFQYDSPDEIPWKESGVDVVIDSTGKYRTTAELSGHLKAGAKYVILSAPARDQSRTIIQGVNQTSFDPQQDKVISNSSCTTNALAATLKVLDDAFVVVEGFATATHAVTDSQNILDNSHNKEVRLRRAAFSSMIPASTGSAKDIGKIFPHLSGKIICQAIRIPLLTVSLITLTVYVKNDVTKDSVNTAFTKAASGNLKGILTVSTEELVSKDYTGDPHSSIIDTFLTKVLPPRFVTVYAWYDNEYGYASRLIEAVEMVGPYVL